MNRFYDIEGDYCVQLAPWIVPSEFAWQHPKIALFRLEKPLRFHSTIAGGVLVVHKGYVSDLASIPRFAWGMFLAPDDPCIELGSWFHDLLYRCHGLAKLEGGRLVELTRKQVDAILCFEAMPVLNASKWQCWVVYLALRCFGTKWGS